MKKSYLITGTVNSKPLLIIKPDEHMVNEGSDLGFPIEKEVAVLSLLPTQENTATLQPTNVSPIYNDTLSKFALSVNNKILEEVGTLEELTQSVKNNSVFSNYLVLSDAESNEPDIEIPDFEVSKTTPRAIIRFPFESTGAMVISFKNNVSGDSISMPLDVREGHAVALINQNKKVLDWMNLNGLWMLGTKHFTIGNDPKPLVFEVVGKDKITILLTPTTPGTKITDVVSDVMSINGAIDEQKNQAWAVIENHLADFRPTPPSVVSSSFFKNFGILVFGTVYGHVFVAGSNTSQDRLYRFYLEQPEDDQNEVFYMLENFGYTFFGEMDYRNGQMTINKGAQDFSLTFTASKIQVAGGDPLPSNIQVTKTSSGVDVCTVFLSKA